MEMAKNSLTMCFSIIFKSIQKAEEFHRNPNIAQEDVTVYKFLLVYTYDDEIMYRSPFQGMEYTKGCTYHEKFNPIISNFSNATFGSTYCFMVDKGLHCLVSIELADIYADYNSGVNHCKLVEMTIPKGTKYYLDEETGEVVTECLHFPDIKN